LSILLPMDKQGAQQQKEQQGFFHETKIIPTQLLQVAWN
jgi:hypothetical protein